MKNLLLIGAMLAPVTAVASTSYECLSNNGDRVVIEAEGVHLEFQSDGKTRQVIEHLNPFLETEATKLVSLTHVADVTSYLENGETELVPYQFARVTIDMSGEGASKVQWKLQGFGESKSFEVLCDKKGHWTADHESV